MVRTTVWRFVFACLIVAALPRAAGANGRLPSSSSITFRQGHESDIAVGLTFGLVVSHDGGATWVWTCEGAIGYSGEYDPRYAFSQSGALFATTHDELKVVRDSCTFNPATTTNTFASADTIASDHTVYYATSEAPDVAHGFTGDYKLYTSTDDGVQFTPLATQPPMPISWWQTLVVAPSDPQRLYLGGYVYVPDPAGGSRKEQRFYRSDNAGASWTALPFDPAQVTVAPNSLIDIVGVSPGDPDHLYMRVTFDDNIINHSLYRSTDKGVSWHRINRKNVKLEAFVVRAAVNSAGNHDLIVGGPSFDAEISHDDGDTWTALPSPPHGRCMVENAAGELWACAENYGSNGVASDGAGVMKTLDPEQGWTKVLRYEELTEAASCPAGTKQKDECAAMWCAVCAQLGCKPSASYDCPVPTEAPVPVAPKAPAGCCDGGGSGVGALALGLSVGMVALWPRRRRRRVDSHAIHPRSA